MGKTFGQMAAEIREINVALGWRLDNGTLGDFVALVHTEVSEAVEAFRDHRLADATKPVCGRAASGEEPCPERGPSKPEGVGSELADVLVRLVDLGDIFGLPVFEPDLELADVAPIDLDKVVWPARLDTFGEYMSWLHHHVTGVLLRRDIPTAIRALVTVAEQFNIDLTFEYERKVSYNRTREFQHGGRTISGPRPAGQPT